MSTDTESSKDNHVRDNLTLEMDLHKFKGDLQRKSSVEKQEKKKNDKVEGNMKDNKACTDNTIEGYNATTNDLVLEKDDNDGETENSKNIEGNDVKMNDLVFEKVIKK